MPSVFHPAEDVISVIKKAGVVLAHPGASFYNPITVLCYDMLELGIQGIECYHIENGEEVTRYALVLRCPRILVTGGSDCHGTFVPERWLEIPKSAFRTWSCNRPIPL